MAKEKAFLFCYTHALPSAMLIDKTGTVVQSHGGEDADDAIYWFNYFKKGENYDVEVIDQELMEKVLYQGESPTILKEKHPEFTELFLKLIEQNKEKKNG